MSEPIELILKKTPTYALRRWLEQYRSFVVLSEAELFRRENPELEMKGGVEIEME